MSINLGITIKTNNRDALRGIAETKLALKGLTGSTSRLTDEQRAADTHARNLNRTLFQQSRTLKTLSGDYVGVRRAMLTLFTRGAIAGLTGVTAALNSMATTVTILGSSLANLTAVGGIVGLAGFAATIQGLGVGLLATNKLMKALTTSGQSFHKAMAKLTKPARDFVNTIKGFKDDFKEIQLLSQQGLFPGVVRGLNDMKPLLGTIKQAVFDTAQHLGYLFERFGQMAGKRKNAIGEFLENNVKLLDRMGRTAENFGFGFINVLNIAQPLIKDVSKSVEHLSKLFLNSTETKGGKKGWATFFDSLKKSWDNWKVILSNSGKVVAGFWEAIQPVTHKVEKIIGGSLGKLADWIGKIKNQKAIGKYFDDSLKPMGAFLKAVGALAKVWVAFSKAGNNDVTSFFDGVRTKFLPLFKDLFLTLDKDILPSLGGLLTGIIDFIDATLPGFKSLLGLFKPLAGFLKNILDAATDIIKLFDKQGSFAGAIGTLVVAATVLSSWKTLRSLIKLTSLEAKIFTGFAGKNAENPTRADFKKAAGSFLPFATLTSTKNVATTAVPRLREARLARAQDRAASTGDAARYNRMFNTRVPAERLPNAMGLIRQLRQEQGLDYLVRSGPAVVRPTVRPGIGQQVPYGATSPSFVSTPRNLPVRGADGRYRDPATGRFVRPSSLYETQSGRLKSNFSGRFVSRIENPSVLAGGGRGVKMGASKVGFAPVEAGVERSAKGGLLRGIKAAGSSLRGAFAGWGPMIALTVGPALITGIVAALRDKRPAIVRELDSLAVSPNGLGGRGRLQLGASKGGFTGQRQIINPRIQRLQDDLTKAVSIKDPQQRIKALRETRGEIDKLAASVKDVSQKSTLEKVSGDIQALQAGAHNAILGRIIPDLDTFAKRGGGSINEVRDGLALMHNAITNKLPLGGREFKAAMSLSFAQAAANIQSGIDSGTISVKKGLAQMHKYMAKELKWLGFSPEQARNIAKGNGRGGQYGDADNNRGREGGASAVIKRAGGGMVGSKWRKGRDNVPAVLNGEKAVVAEGEYVGVFNRTQQQAFDGMAKQSGYGGMEGFFRGNSTPHYMASGGVISGAQLRKSHPELKPGIANATAALLSKFPGLQITATTNGNHVANSYHYKGEATDTASGDQGLMDRAGAWAQSRMGAGLTEGIHNPSLHIKDGRNVSGPGVYGGVWAGHRNHIHMAVAAAFKALGIDISKVKIPQTNLPGAWGGAVNSVLGIAGSAMNSMLGKLGNLGGAGSAADMPTVKGNWSKADLMRLWVQAGGPANVANIAAAIALAESGGDPNAGHQHPYHGLWQVGPGGSFDPWTNAKEAVAKYHGAGDKFTPWTTYTGYDTPNHEKTYLRYLAGGGAFAAGVKPPGVNQGYPDVNPKDATPNADKPGRNSSGKKSGKSTSRHYNPFSKRYEMLTAAQYHRLVARWQGQHPKQPMPTSPKNASTKYTYNAPGKPALGQGIGRTSFHKGKKVHLPIRKQVKKLLHHHFKFPSLVDIDPVTGNATNVFDDQLAELASMDDTWGNKLGTLTDRQAFTEISPTVDLFDSNQFKDLTAYLTANPGVLGGSSIADWMANNGNDLEVVNQAGMKVQGDFMPGISQGVGQIDEQLAWWTGKFGLDPSAPAPAGGRFASAFAKAAVNQKYGFHGILGLHQYEQKWLQKLPTKKATAAYRSQLAKAKKIFEANRDLREKYADKIKKMQNKGLTWQNAVHYNNGIITAWSRWQRDNVGESPEETRQANHEKDRLRTENTWLQRHKPKSSVASSKGYAETVGVYNQRGAENEKLVGKLNIDASRWNPSNFGGRVGWLWNQWDGWNDADTKKTDTLHDLANTLRSDITTIMALKKDRAALTGTRVSPLALDSSGGGADGSSNIDDITALKAQLGDDLIKGNFLHGLQASVLNEFAPLLNKRIGAFAHGGVVPETGMALVHKGEYVVPNPDGPFRNGVNALQSGDHHFVIEVHNHGETAALLKLVDARVKKVAPSATSKTTGANARLIARSPGRR